MTDSNPAGLAERYYVGALLHLRGAVAQEAMGAVLPDDLADPQLRTVLTAMVALAADGRDPDPAAVTPRMLELGLVGRDRCGLVNVALVGLLSDVPAPACWPAYAGEVLRESARRTILEVATRAGQAADEGNLETAVRVLTEGLEQAQQAVRRALVGVAA